MRLKDKVAIVTGAASGIGKEIANTFAREGARVVIADLNQKAADATAAEIGDSRKALGVAMDVTNEQQVEAGVARTVEQFGKVDVLVSNAGIQIVAPLDQFEFASWKKLLSIHLDGAFLTTRAVLQRMYKQGSGGSIIYMGSVHSKEASMLKETVDGEFTTVADVAETAVFFAGFESNALTGQSLVVSHGWFMQ